MQRCQIFTNAIIHDPSDFAALSAAYAPTVHHKQHQLIILSLLALNFVMEMHIYRMLIHANHGQDIRDFLLESLRGTQNEVIACETHV